MTMVRATKNEPVHYNPVYGYPGGAFPKHARPETLLQSDDEESVKIAIVLIDGFSPLTYQALVEPFHVLNTILERKAVQIKTVSLRSETVTAADQSSVTVDLTVDQLSQPDIVILCGSPKPRQDCYQSLINWLRMPEIRQLNIGAVDSACLPLMESGLLDGYKCTIHWRYAATAQNLFPQLNIEKNMLQFDRNRFTCTGGIVTLKLVIELCRQYFDETIAQELAAQYNFDMQHSGQETQRRQISYTAVAGNNRLNRALQFINENLDNPLNLNEIARMSGLSKRQLERHFKKFLGISPAAHIQKMRLMRAVDLLQGTNLSVTQIAYSCGFNSSSHFAKKFRACFGKRPRDLRI